MKTYIRSVYRGKFASNWDQTTLSADRDSPGWGEEFDIPIMAQNLSEQEKQGLAHELAPYLPQPVPIPPPNGGGGGGGNGGGSGNPDDVPFEVYDTGLYNLSNKSGCCAFTEECVRRLHAIDPDWGHVKKTGAQESCPITTEASLHAVDAVFNRRIPEARDIIVNSGVPGAAPAWNITGTPPLSSWFPPGGASTWMMRAMTARGTRYRTARIVANNVGVAALAESQRVSNRAASQAADALHSSGSALGNIQRSREGPSWLTRKRSARRASGKSTKRRPRRRTPKRTPKSSARLMRAAKRRKRAIRSKARAR